DPPRQSRPRRRRQRPGRRSRRPPADRRPARHRLRPRPGGTVDIGAYELQTDLSKITALRSTVKVDEGAQAINFGAIGYLVTASHDLDVTASAGPLTVFDDNTWVWFSTPPDDLGAPTSVTITARDANGVPATVTYGLAVRNVAPTASITGAPASGHS